MDLPAAHDREESLCRLWEERAEPGLALHGARGERIVVISRGTRNRSAGPDYNGAVMVIDGEISVGDVEMHLSERDWFLHGHDGDPAFGSVVLHLLGDQSTPLRLPIPTVTRADLERSVPVSVEPERPERDAISPALLAELSWSRFLRRVVTILREEPERPRRSRVERAFIRRMFDALGYADNREAMRELAERLLVREEAFHSASLEEIMALLAGLSGIDSGLVLAEASGYLDPGILARIAGASGGEALRWKHGGRRGNNPARRLLGVSVLTFDLFARSGLGPLLEQVASDAPPQALVRPLTVRIGTVSLVGAERAAEIVINVLLPVALADAIFRADFGAIERICRRYRTAPSLGSNRIIRLIESRYLRNERLIGAFWQQGAIEFRQRYLSPDRSGISFVADPVGNRRPG
jgi:hypothetical protein